MEGQRQELSQAPAMLKLLYRQLQEVHNQAALLLLQVILVKAAP
jgi:hypothetical protein